MGYFKDLKFGPKVMDPNLEPFNDIHLKLISGDFRTEGTFAPGSKSALEKQTLSPVQTPTKPEEWKPTVLLKALSVKSKDGQTKRYEPGFLPPAFLAKQIVDKKLGKGKINEYSWNEDNTWVGHLLNSHIESDYYKVFEEQFKSKDTEYKIKEKTTDVVESDAYSARDFYIRFNDQSTDYFRHNLHIDGYTNLKSGKNARESWTGRAHDEFTSEENFRLASFKNTPYENNDPVTYGFQIVIDAVSSPLLNGSVEEFISQFSYISEIASKAIVIDDFKRQFSKIFKTKGNLNIVDQNRYGGDDVLINAQRNGQSMVSSSSGLLYDYVNAS